MSNYLKIGDLAKITGITVRTLHYYDEIGLLKPICNTDSGHRLYDMQNLNYLYRIIAMKEMGLNLEEIKSLLLDKEININELINLQVLRLQDEIAQKQLLLGKLLKVKQNMNDNKDMQLDDFQELMQFISLSADRYFTLEQLLQLKRNHQNNIDNKSELNQDWLLFITKLTNCYKNNLPKTDPLALECSEYWKRVTQKLIGSDEQMMKSVQEFHTSTENSSMRYGLSNELYQYLLTILG